MSGSAPDAVVFDLDDTLIDERGGVDGAWRAALAAVPAASRPRLYETLRATERWYWSDPGRHRAGRMRLAEARLAIVRRAFATCGYRDQRLTAAVAHSYGAARDAALKLMPAASEVLAVLRARGVALALVTNGSSSRQRQKLARFGLGDRFDAVLIEEELGFGKPDRRIYDAALTQLGAEPAHTWIVGDDPEWEVAAPHTIGLRTMWLDRWRRGAAACRTPPDRVITSLLELVA